MNLIPRDFFLDDFFNEFKERENNMKCDIYEKNGNYHIEMDAPGITKKDLQIECDKGYLTISISKKSENNEEEKNYIRKERTSKELKRSFYLGDVDTDNIKAELKDGFLNIVIPKKEEIETKKTIEIE